MLNLVIVGQNV